VADQLGQAVLTLTVDDQQFNAGLNRAQQQATTAGQKIGQTFDGLANVFKNLAGVAGIVGIGALTQQIISTGQASERSKIQLQSLAGAYNEAAQAAAAASRIQQVLGISALDARQNFSQLYAALRGTGIGLQQLEVLFVGISNAARLSGAGTAEASAALLQLKQGLASGRLQGDELRSVLEQLPAFAQAIAKELNVNVGALRQLGSDGKITSEIVFNAAKKLAAAAAPGRTQVEQLGIAFTNLKETAAASFGPALVGVIQQVAAGIAAFSRFIQENQTALSNFGKSVVNLGRTLLPFAAGILAVRAAFSAWALAAKAVAVAQAAVLALQGPKGWVVLAAALGASALAAAALEKGYKGVAGAVGKASEEAERAKAAFAAMLNTTELKPGAMGAQTVDNKVLAEQQQQRIEAELALQNVQQRIAYAKQLAAAEAGVVRETIRQRQEIEAGVQAAKDQITLIGAQIDALRLQGKDKGIKLQKLVDQQNVAAEEVRLKLIEGASALRDASRQLAEDAKRATLELAGIRNDPGGLNKFLNQQQIQERGQATLQLLLPSFRQAQSRFTQLTGAQAPEFRGTTSGVIDSVRQFIENVDREFNATNNVRDTQQALVDATAGLKSINERLATVTEQLAAKNWQVNVNVPGGTASGDVLGPVNAGF
jgi:tape measure domain-containing protein